MDHIKILKRAFEITRTYRVLWIFGILLALTTAGRGGSPNYRMPSGDNTNWTRPIPNLEDFNFPEDFNWILPNITDQLVSTLIALGIGLVCFILLLAVAGSIVRYVSETALIRMVDSQEASGEKVGFRQGWRLGWSRAALHIFLVDLLLGIASTVVFLILFGVALAPLLVWLTDSVPLQVIGTVAAIGLGLLVIFLAILVGIILALLIRFIRRACILENLGVFTAMRRGIALVWQRIGDVIIMGIIMFALGLAYLIVLIPVILILVVVGAIVAGLPALMIGAVVGIFMEGPTPWIVAAIVGIPVFMLIILVPSTFLSGLVETFKSSTWTLVYRELAALESMRTGEAEASEGEPLIEEPAT